MPMPSLFKYFAFVGAALLGLLSLVNFLLDPSTGATAVASAPGKPVIAVQHDPRASKIERWRDEQAALKAAQQTQTSENASLATKSTPEPYRPAPTATAAPQPAQPATAAQSEPGKPEPAAADMTATAAMVGVETAEEAAATRAAQVAERKAKVARAKAKKERLARERAFGQQVAGDGGVPLAGHYGTARTASNQQDQYYYGQRGGSQQLTTRYSSAYAPQQSYGPFGRGW